MDKELKLKALREAGLSEDLIDQITATTDDELTTQIAELKVKHPPTAKISLVELLKDEGFKAELSTHVEGLVKSETDRRVTQALETFEKKIKPDKKEDDDAVTKEIGELKTLVTGLSEKLTGQQETQKQESIKVLATIAIEKAGLPVNWVSRVQVDSEDKIDEAVKVLKTEYDGIKQGVIDDAIKNSPIPGLALGDSGNITQTTIDNFAKTLEKDTKQAKTVELEPKT